MFDDRLRAVGANVRDGDPVLACGFDVDVVRACRSEADETDRRAGFEHFRRQADLVAEHDGGVANTFDCLPGPGVSVDVQRRQQGLHFRDIEVRAHRVPVEEYCFHVDIRSRVSQSTGR